MTDDDIEKAASAPVVAVGPPARADRPRGAVRERRRVRAAVPQGGDRAAVALGGHDRPSAPHRRARLGSRHGEGLDVEGRAPAPRSVLVRRVRPRTKVVPVARAAERPLPAERQPRRHRGGHVLTGGVPDRADPAELRSAAHGRAPRGARRGGPRGGGAILPSRRRAGTRARHHELRDRGGGRRMAERRPGAHDQGLHDRSGPRPRDLTAERRANVPGHHGHGPAEPPGQRVPHGRDRRPRGVRGAGRTRRSRARRPRLPAASGDPSVLERRSRDGCTFERTSLSTRRR